MRQVTEDDIPTLEHHCNSWVVIRKDDGQVIGEFTQRSSLVRFNADRVEIKTTAKYLGSLAK